MQNLGTPLVSVITCFLNVEKFLPETIQSVLWQNHTNWELILVDDGSSDGSTAIAQEYARRYPSKIYYYEHQGHQNKGASYSRNVAIKYSKGDFISFLDGDDVWHPTYLSTQIKLAQENPAAGLICEATEYWHDWNNPDLKNNIIPVGAPSDHLYYPPQLSEILYPLGTGNAPCICGMIVKRSVIEKHGMFEEAFKGMYDDQVFLTKIYLHEPVYLSSACHNRYRQRPGSLVHSSNNPYSDYYTVRKRFLKWMEAYLHQQKLNYPEIKSLLMQNMFYRRPPLLKIKDVISHIKRRYLMPLFK